MQVAQTILIVVLLCEVAIVGTTMSVTCDESGHFGAAAYTWDHGRFDVYRVNPPLVRAVAGLPVLLLNPTRDYRRSEEGPAIRVEWKLGQDLIAANREEWSWYFLAARWAVVPFALFGAFLVQKWAAELYDHSETESVIPYPFTARTVSVMVRAGWS